MMLFASTWVPATPMKTDPWIHSIPQAVTSSVQCEKPAFVKVGRTLFHSALRVQPWDGDRTRDGWTEGRLETNLVFTSS